MGPEPLQSFVHLPITTMTNSNLGIGGAPTRATTFPSDAKGRKQRPVSSGVLDYFPDAIVALAEVSWRGNEQHNPGMPLHWDRSKSTDEADSLMRHFLQRGTMDDDGIRHSQKLAWRALALLQKEIESEHRVNAKDGLKKILGEESRNAFREAMTTRMRADEKKALEIITTRKVEPPFVPLADPSIRKPGDCLIPPYAIADERAAQRARVAKFASAGPPYNEAELRATGSHSCCGGGSSYRHDASDGTHPITGPSEASRA